MAKVKPGLHLIILQAKNYLFPSELVWGPTSLEKVIIEKYSNKLIQKNVIMLVRCIYENWFIFGYLFTRY